MLASIRPDSWNFPLLLHVTGAMVLVGALATVVTTLILSRRGDTTALTQLGFRTLLYVGLPAFVLMRAAAEWIASKEDVPDDIAWLGIGYTASDFGLLVIIVATVLTGLAVRRLRRDPANPGRLGGIASWLIAIALAGYAVAIWAMTTKPD
jgi:hypothetical protein